MMLALGVLVMGISDLGRVLDHGELWRRWRLGESQVGIARGMGVAAWRVTSALRRRGGIAPRERTLRAGALTAAEREAISRHLALGASSAAIGHALGRAGSTISREIARNGGRLRYRAVAAGLRAADQALRPKPCKLSGRPELAALVGVKLAARWSPCQIAGWLKREHPGAAAMQISAETIYRSLFIQARGALKAELVDHLRSRKIMRRPHAKTPDAERRGRFGDAVSIRERPAEVEDRALPGHWEGDLLLGRGRSQIATLVERHSRYVLLVRLEGRDTVSVVDALIDAARSLPEGLMQSLTWDNGKEMAGHRRFTLATDAMVYFCDPRSPWQRGSNENTNGLLREYFPKGMSLATVSQAELDQVATSLNTRPRQTLGFQTPAAILAKAMQ
jgi:IS30 family transposase